VPCFVFRSRWHPIGLLGWPRLSLSRARNGRAAEGYGEPLAFGEGLLHEIHPLAATLSWIGVPTRHRRPPRSTRLPAERRRMRGGNADAGAPSTPSADRARGHDNGNRELGRCLPPEGATADAAAPIVAERLDLNAEKALETPQRQLRYDIIESASTMLVGCFIGFKRQLQDAAWPPTRFLPITVIVLPQSERTGQALEQPFGARVSSVRRPNFLPLD
jgi:hypothetical protein